MTSQTNQPSGAPERRTARGAWPALLIYGTLAAAFCLPIFEHPGGLGVALWDRHLFYYGSVVRNAVHGQLPFWNPWSCGGTALWQHPDVSLISPVYVLAAVMPLALAIKVNIVLHYGLGFAGMHLLLRRVVGLSTRALVAYLASLFVFSGALALGLAEGRAELLPAFLLPLLLYCVLRGAGSIRHTLLGGAVFAVYLLDGGLQTAVAVAFLLIAIAAFIVVVGRTWRPALTAVVILALGAVLAAPKVVPTARFVGSADVADTRGDQPPDRMTMDMLWHALTDRQHRSPAAFDAGRSALPGGGNYLGWFGAPLALASGIWIVATRRRRDQPVPQAIVLALALLLFLSLGAFSPFAPASLLHQLPWDVGRRVTGSLVLLVPLLAALAIGFAVRDLGGDRAPRVARQVLMAASLVALAQLGYANGSLLRDTFSLPPLGSEARLYQRANQVQIAASPGPAADGASPLYRSLLEDVSWVNCGEPVAPVRVAAPGTPMLSGEGAVTFFESAFSPNRMAARVVAGRDGGRVILNQNYAHGWSSTAGPVVRDGGGRPSVLLPPGFAGTVVFSFRPPGLWFGLGLFVVAVGLCVLAWRHATALDQVATRADQALTRRTATLTARVDIAQIVVVLLAAGVFAWAYLHYPYRPTAPATGWWNYWDQGAYLRSARAFAVGVLEGSEHWYPIGYPLLAAPFVPLFADPFLPINAVGFIAYIWLCYRLFHPALGRWAVLVPIFVPLIYPAQVDVQPAVSYPLLSQFAVPWNSNPVAPAYLAALLGVRANWRRENRTLDVGLGVLLGLTAAIRPADAALLAVLLGVYSTWAVLARRRWLVPALVAAGALACMLPVSAFMQQAYGGLESPYVVTSRIIGFSLSDLGDRVYQILLRSEETYGEPHSALFQLQPWLHAAVPLAVVWAWRVRGAGALAVAMALSSWLLYLAYNDLSPFNFLRFFLVHYIVWTLPVLACAGLAGAVCIVRERRWATAGLVLVVAAGSASVRLSTVPVGGATLTTEPGAAGLRYALAFPSRQTVDAIDVAGLSHGNAVALSTMNVGLTADDVPLAVPSGYQLVRGPDGLRIIFNRHISVQRLAFTFDGTVGRDAARAPGARPVRFVPTLGMP